MRVEQGIGARGSLKWMQTLVASGRHLIDPELRGRLGLPDEASIEWRSPLAEDQQAEYRDASFLTRIGLSYLAPELRKFWPHRGPQWDGLAVSSGMRILIEAKAHVDELGSHCVASPRSRQQIANAFYATKRDLGASEDCDWLDGYYQYANRLAHLKFLRAAGVDAHLVFLYFTGDRDIGGPTSPVEWENALIKVYRHLGLDPERSPPGVHSIYVNVQDLM
jgi:hypothetical protein